MLAFSGTGTPDEFGALIDNVSLKAVYSATLDDEDALGQVLGNQGGPGDDGAGSVAKGKILFDAGTDGLKSIVTEGIAGLKAIHVDANGVGTQYGVTQAWVPNGSDAGGELTGTIVVPGVVGAIKVYTLTIDASGNYTLTMHHPLVHPDTDNRAITDVIETSFEDNLALDFRFTITDGDGDQATGVITVVIDDDTPVANDHTGGSYVEGAGAQDLGVATQVLGIKPGADGLLGTLQQITFSNTGGTGGTLAINITGKLIYTPAANVGPAGATETFSYTVTDGDGDTVTRQVTFKVTDTNAAPTADPVTLRVSEEGLPTGIPDSKAGSGAQDETNFPSATGSLNVHDADGDPLTLTFTGPLPSLKSGGQDIVWTGNGTGQLVGKVGSATIITLTLNATGQVSAVLSGPVDHASGGGENELSFTLGWSRIGWAGVYKHDRDRGGGGQFA